MLVIERSIEHEAFPTGVGAVNSWRFLAVSLMPVSEGGEGGSSTCGSNQSNSPALYTGGVFSRAPPEPEPVVEVNLVLQVDLGAIAERFTSEYAFERADVIQHLAAYMALPSWPRERARLDAHGFKMPPIPPLNSSERRSRRRGPGMHQGASPSGMRATHADADDMDAEKMYPVMSDSALHRAQVLALTELRSHAPQ